MVKPTTFWLVVSVALTHIWLLRQIDINNDFLHGPLFKTIFMQQPFGFIDHSRPHFVCKLNNATYGLKQALQA